MVSGSMFDGIGTMLIVGFIAIVAFVGLLIYNIYDWTKSPKTKTLESKTILVPEIKLHTDGKTVDTIYVYKLK